MWQGKKILVYMLLYADDILDEKVQNNSKLIWQIHSFEKMGLDVWYFLYAKDQIYLCNKDNKIPVRPSVGGYRGFVHRHYMNNAFFKVYKKYGPFDYAYVRKMIALPSFIRVLKTLHARGTKVIYEIPTYSTSKISEDAMSGRQFRVWIEPILKKLDAAEAKYIDLYSVIGEKACSINGVPAVNINNGMNALEASDLPRRNHQYTKECHMLALGNMRAYHGLDRIIYGLKKYNTSHSDKAYLHIVGMDSDGSLASNLELAKTLGIEKYVIHEGFCTGEKLNQICDICDVAFCALAYYIKGGTVGNELKTREYMSRGIPFVISVPDDSLDDNARYIMHVSNDAEPIRIEDIVKFAQSFSGDSHVVNEMQQYALKNMTWIPELEKVLTCVDAQSK